MEKNSLADRFIVPPYSVIDARKGSWKERKKVWQSEIGPVANSREESLYESLAMRMPDLYVSTYEHRKQLGISFKDYVQRYVDKEVLEKEMQKMPFYGVSCFDPVLAEVIYHWFTPGSNSKIFDCFAGDITKGYVATKCGHTFSGIELRSEQVEENKVRCAELGVNAMYVQDDGRNVVNHLGCATQDLFITCPPYYDLEIYSDNANDASARQTYREFLKVIDEAITQSLISLKKNRFAVAIVSDIRDKAGAYSCFPEDIISVFRRRGCILWNDIIYLNNDSHAQIRAAQYMNRRKVVRMHQRGTCVFTMGAPVLYKSISEKSATMIREAIKNRIADLGLSQREICSYAGMREQNLSSFLCGTRSFSMRKLSALLGILGLTVGDARYVVGKYPPAEIYLAVADRISERGLKLRELSSLCSVNESSLSLFLKGRRLLELESLERVMTALGLELVSYGRPQLL